MKKRCLAMILAVLMVVSLLPAVVFASQATKDGLQIQQTTDKTAYSSKDDITTKLTVTNLKEYNTDVKNVILKNYIPQGYKVKSGNTKLEVPTLKIGETATLTTVFYKPSNDNNNSTVSKNDTITGRSSSTVGKGNPATGDFGFGNYILIVGILLLSVGVIALTVKKGRKSKNLTMFILCFLLAGACVSAIGGIAIAKENDDKEIILTENVTVDGAKLDVKSGVSYEKRMPEKYEVIFDGNYEGSDYNQKVTETAGEKYVLPEANPTRIGYTFAGWFTMPNGGSQITSETSADSSVKNAYAHWNANAYNVSFDANGGTGDPMSVQPFTYDIAQNLQTNTYTKLGYDFLGWNTDKSATTALYVDGQEVNNLSTIQNDSITLYAIWKEKSNVTINYVSADEQKGTVSPASEAVAPATGVAKGSVATPAAGYHFVNWTDSTGSVVCIDAVFVPAKEDGLNIEATYTANFGANTYKVTFNGNGASGWDPATELDETYDAKYILPAKSPLKIGYTFDGWFTGATDGTQVTEDTIVKITEPTTLYAHWTPIIYQTTFLGNYEGSDYSETLGEIYDAKFTLPETNPTRTGYTFAGWFTKAEGGKEITSETIVDASVRKAYAHWSANTYTVEFDPNGGSGSMAPQTFTYDTAQRLAANCFIAPERMIFLGWNTDPSATTAMYLDEEEVSNLISEQGGTVTLYAIWEESACVASGTMITMGDGGQKAVENIEIGDVVRTVDHETGDVSAAPVCFVWKTENASDAFTLNFENDIDVTIIEEHGFFDQEEKQYVFINALNASDYIGHHFYNADTDSWLELMDFEVLQDRMDAYAIVTSGHLNHLSNGMLSMCDGSIKLIANIFEYDDNLTFDAQKKQADIQAYGLTSIEKILEYEGFYESDYYDYNLQYLNVAIGKGILTWEMVQELSDYCVANGL